MLFSGMSVTGLETSSNVISKTKRLIRVCGITNVSESCTSGVQKTFIPPSLR